MGQKNKKGIKFHYIKNSNFRVIHTDGVIGSITPANLIHMSLFSERPCIPQEVIYEVLPDGVLGEPVEQVSKDGFVREIDIDAVFSLEAAKSFHDWLGKHIAQVEKNNKG